MISCQVAAAVQCDVTKADDVKNFASKTAEVIGSTNSKLWAVVNNAGIGDGGAIDLCSMETLRKVMEVNFFGGVLTIKTFLPMLKCCPGSRFVFGFGFSFSVLHIQNN